VEENFRRQYGCVFIDEINIANMDYIREISMRCDYLLGTLNPDDPNLAVYREFINHSRPLPEWRHDAPKEILEMLNETEKPGLTHWFFSFKDNLGLSKEKMAQIIASVPPGTKIYMNKIQGLRVRATGLIFPNFSRKNNVITAAKAKQFKFAYFSCGVDTAYSQESPDTIAFIFQRITNSGKLGVLDEKIYNNADLDIPLAPSDIPPRLIDFLEKNRKEWGFARDVFIDNADQATITEMKKYKRRYGCVYNFLNSYKKIKKIDRIHFMLGWINV
jgi:phage terminase large subunit